MSDINQDRKAALQNTISSASDAIEQQVDTYKEVGKNVLIVGGIVLGGYLLSRIFSSDEEEEETEEPVTVHKHDGGDSIVSSAIKGMATTLILTLVKDKLLDFIEHQINKNEP